MYNFIICSVFKNEAHILDEWIKHYLLHGVEHIYLVNDFSTDNYIEIIDKYKENVTIINNDIITKEVGRQIQIYNKYFKPILNKTKWMAILDLDEFLYSPYDINIQNYINKYDSYSQIIIDWLHFGSNEHILQPNSVIEGFIQRAKFDTTKTYYSYKSIFKTCSLINFDIHKQIIKGSELHLKYNDNDVPPLIINHYNLQSLNFYLNIKGTRGDINNWFDYKNLERNKEYFISYDKNDLEDLRLYIQNKIIINDVKLEKINMKNDDVTFVITSCNRPFLLDKTIESFIKYNTYPIKQTIIIDDSGIINCNETIIEKYKEKLNIISLYNNTNISQLRSIDKIYSYITTKYIFHCEEDWEFLQSSFIEKSKNIFDKNKELNIFTIWLRPHNHTSGHPIIYDNKKLDYYLMDKTFSYKYENKTYTWCGATFNPGLRKTSDMYLYHPFCNNCSMIEKNKKLYPLEGEYTINSLYRDSGYCAFILSDPNGHVKHLGDNYHINVNY
jgi:hypothetical protein